MRSDLTIRRLTARDADILAQTLELLAGNDDEADIASRADAGHLEKALASPSCYVFLAIDRDGPVGYVIGYRFPRFDHASDQLYLFDIEVAEPARQRGIGQRLMDELLATCWAEGITWMWAGTARENTPAQRLFAAVGGERAGETYLEFEFEPGK